MLKDWTPSITSPPPIHFSDDEAVNFGTGDTAKVLWETADANANVLLFVLPAGGSVDVPVAVFGSVGGTTILNADLGLFDGITYTTLAVVDNDNDSWVGLDFYADEWARVNKGGSAFLAMVAGGDIPAATNISSGFTGIDCQFNFYPTLTASQVYRAAYFRSNYRSTTPSNPVVDEFTGVEGVAASYTTEEAITFRGGYFRTYINADATSTMRTNIGLEASARASYSGGTACVAEAGTCFTGIRVWMAPYFSAGSVDNLNNFWGLWIYGEHATQRNADSAIKISDAGGGFTYDITFQEGTTLVDDGTNLTLAGANLSISDGKLILNDLMLKRYSANWLMVRDSADTAYQYIYAKGALVTETFSFVTTGGALQTDNSDSYYFTGKARDTGVGMVEVFRVAGAADPYFSTGGSQQFKFHYSGVMSAGTSGSPLSLTAGTPIMSLYSTCSSAGGTDIEPFYVKSVMTGAGGIGGRAKFHAYSNVVLGSYANALKGYMEFGASGAVTGLGSAIVGELVLSAGTVNGTYAALEAELVAGSGAKTGTDTSFIYCNGAGDDVATTIDTLANLIELGVGLTVGSGKFVDTDITTHDAYGGLRVKIPGVGIRYLALVSN